MEQKMKEKREEILKILELKNEQSFYTKQRQDKRIINFLKSIPTAQLQEFNNYETNSYSIMSQELSHTFLRKLLKLIKILNNKDQENYILFQKFFAHLMCSLCQSEYVMEKFYINDKNVNLTADDYKHHLVLNYELSEIKESILNFMPHFKEFNSISASQGLGEFLSFLMSLNEYDYIFLANNHINFYQPVIVDFHFLSSQEVNLFKKFILEQLYYYNNYDLEEGDIDLLYEKLKDEPIETKFNILHKAILEHSLYYQRNR